MKASDGPDDFEVSDTDKLICETRSGLYLTCECQCKPSPRSDGIARCGTKRSFICLLS